MTATERYLSKIGFTGNVDNLEEVLDFMDEKKNIYVYYIPFGMDKVLITETPNCLTLTGVLRLSVLYAARYLSQKMN